MKGFRFIGTRVAGLMKFFFPLLIAGGTILVVTLLGRADPFQRRSLIQVIAGLFVFCLFDAGLVISLPRLGLSFGPPAFPVFVLVFARGVIFLVWVGVFAITTGAATPALYWVANLLLVLLLVYGFVIEPFDLRVTRLEITPKEGQVSRQLRIVHLSDLHVEQTTKRERDIARRVHELKPDLIVLTGDYLNLSYLDDSQAISDARDFLMQLKAPLGVFAVNGSVDNEQRMQRLFTRLEIVVLNDRAYRLQEPGLNLGLVGLVDWDRPPEVAALDSLARAAGEPGTFKMLLFHTPDLIHEAARAGFDLYLCGHTHGGQIRLPVYGAVVTASALGKQFEAGRYQVGPTTLYVSRGLGLEGSFAPRVRFLAPPEIVVIDLIPAPAGGLQ